MSKRNADNRIQPLFFEDKPLRHLISLVILAVSIFIAYSNSLNGTWALDDIITNKPIGLNDIHAFLGYRKITYITFFINQKIAPFSPINFRLFNLLIHFLNAALMYALLYKTLLLVGMADRKKIFFAALLGSLAFALHPININAVAYIVQRMASLAAFFVLLALFCYIHAVQSDKNLRAFVLYILSGVLVAAGIFSKENAVMAIPLIMLYDYVFLAKFNSRLFAGGRLMIAGAGLICILGVAAYLLEFHYAFFDLVKFFARFNQPLAEKNWMAVDVFWTPLQHILTEFRIVSRYLFLIVIPLPRLLVFDWWGYPVSTGLMAPVTTLLSLIFLAVLLVFSIWKLKKMPLLCFGILWYLIAIALESFIALGSDLYFEHRNYLPAAGLFIGLASQAVMSFNFQIKNKAVWIAAAVFCLALGSLTYARNYVWKDSIHLWEDTVMKAPSNIRAIMALGNSYLKMSDMTNTEKYYIEALKVSSRDKRVHFVNDSVYSLGMVYLFEGKLSLARELIEKFDYGVESYKPKILKGFYKALNNDMEGALREYNEVLGETKGIDTVVVLSLAGDVYNKKGLWGKAIEYYTSAISLEPGFSAAYHGLGISYIGKRNLTQAEEYFDKAISLDPDNFEALADMADLLLIKQDYPDKALAYAQRAVSKSPTFYKPYLTMGNVLIVMGKEKEAGGFYKKALERNMPEYMVPFSMARAFYMRGDREKAEYYLSQLQRHKGLPENIKSMLAKRP